MCGLWSLTIVLSLETQRKKVNRGPHPKRIHVKVLITDVLDVPWQREVKTSELGTQSSPQCNPPMVVIHLWLNIPPVSWASIWSQILLH